MSLNEAEGGAPAPQAPPLDGIWPDNSFLSLRSLHVYSTEHPQTGIDAHLSNFQSKSLLCGVVDHYTAT